MSKKDPLRVLNYLEHILEAIKRINHYTYDMDEPTFLKNELVQDAVIRNLEIIGEASKNIDHHHPDFSIQYPDLPLKFAYEMRNALAHGYFKTDFEIVWNTIETDLPQLEAKVQKIYLKHKPTD